VVVETRAGDVVQGDKRVDTLESTTWRVTGHDPTETTPWSASAVVPAIRSW
jgi:hypothetical protein